MSWLFSRALVQEYLGTSSLGLRTVCAVRWIGTADAFLHSDKMTDRLEPFSLYWMTFVPDGRAWRGRCDFVSGGFPCQAFNTAARVEIFRPKPLA